MWKQNRYFPTGDGRCPSTTRNIATNFAQSIHSIRLPGSIVLAFISLGLIILSGKYRHFPPLSQTPYIPQKRLFS